MSALFPYAVTTGDVTVRVAVTFQQESADPDGQRWFWVYHIRIENNGSNTIQLIDREWEIFDARGALNKVEGSGVVGEQPVIQPGRSYDYVSGCPLSTPSGRMMGRYGMMDGDGRRFSVAIPEFPLFGPAVSL
ncbi:MAG: Co2+/Mg2+ efflux protein ApaG [Sphingopyxis sp.]